MDYNFNDKVLAIQYLNTDTLKVMPFMTLQAVRGNSRVHVLVVNHLFYTGKVSTVEGTYLDLQKPTALGDILDKLPEKYGLCHAHLLPGKTGERKSVAR